MRDHRGDDEFAVPMDPDLRPSRRNMTGDVDR